VRLRRARYQDDQRRMRGRSCAPTYPRCDGNEDICRARNFNWQNSQSNCISLSEVPTCFKGKFPAINSCRLGTDAALAWRAGVVWLSDITTVSKAFAGAYVSVTLSNFLNTKKGRPVRVYCKNYHVVTALRLAVLTARCVAQKGL
jgi:hypothetical protein